MPAALVAGASVAIGRALGPAVVAHCAYSQMQAWVWRKSDPDPDPGPLVVHIYKYGAAPCVVDFAGVIPMNLLTTPRLIVLF